MLELGHESDVQPERQRALDTLLADEPALLIEACCGDLRLALEPDVAERVSPPEREGLSYEPIASRCLPACEASRPAETSRVNSRTSAAPSTCSTR